MAVASLASVESGISESDGGMLDELLRDGNGLEVIGKISTLRSGIVEPFDFGIRVSKSFTLDVQRFAHSEDELGSSRSGLDGQGRSDINCSVVKGLSDRVGGGTSIVSI